MNTISNNAKRYDSSCCRALGERWPTLDQWWDIVESITKIGPVYDRMNYAMSLGYDRLARLLAFKYFEKVQPRATLDIGTGPGTSLRALLLTSKYVVALDPSATSLLRLRYCSGYGHKCDRVIAVAEHLPLREGSVDYATAFFSARDFIDIWRGISEALRTTRRGLVVTDIFLPKSILWRIALMAWICFIVPIIALIIATPFWKNYLRLCRTLKEWIHGDILVEYLARHELRVERISVFKNILEVIIGEKRSVRRGKD